MCGAAVSAQDHNCRVCGENLTDVDQSEGPSVDGISVKEVRTFVGKGADYYLARWQRVHGGGKRGAGFNWAAFLFSGLWLPFRKMYRATFIFFGFILGESIAEEILFVVILGQPEVPVTVDRLGSIIISLICGTYGNKWYLSRIRSEIIELKSQGMPEDAYLQSLSRRGGTNLAAAIGLVTILMSAMIAVFLALDFVIGGE